MTLGELLEDLESFDNELTIYAEKTPYWTWFSSVIVCRETDGRKASIESEGKKYFLEVALAKEVRDVWQDWRQGKRPTTEQLCDAVIYYANNDSYIPVSSED